MVSTLSRSTGMTGVSAKRTGLGVPDDPTRTRRSAYVLGNLDKVMRLYSRSTSSVRLHRQRRSNRPE